MHALLRRPVYMRPEEVFMGPQQTLDNLSRLIEIHGKNLLAKHKNSLSLVHSRLESLSPMAILERGYSVTRKTETGELIKSVKDLKAGVNIETLLKDGSIYSRADKIKGKK